MLDKSKNYIYNDQSYNTKQDFLIGINCAFELILDLVILLFNCLYRILKRSLVVLEICQDVIDIFVGRLQVFSLLSTFTHKT